MKGFSVSGLEGEDEGGKSCTFRRVGEENRSNENRARCFGIFQFTRPG